MEELVCQSCGMPLKEELYGTNKNGNANTDYCTYCYQEGSFTSDCTMEEMIQKCIKYLDEFNKDSEKQFTEEEAVAQMRLYFPQLKRWKIAEES